MTTNSCVQEEKSCLVCRSSSGTVVDRSNHLLAASLDPVRQKLASWEANPRREGCRKLAREDEVDFLVCESCLGVIEDVDRLEVELEKRLAALWTLVDAEVVETLNDEESICDDQAIILDESGAQFEETKEPLKPRKTRKKEKLVSNEVENDSSGSDEIEEAFTDQKCPCCGLNLERGTSLERHIRDEHKNCGSFPCQQCNKSFKKLDSLRRHQKRTHLSNKSFICEECGKVVTNHNSLREHMKSHITSLCPICGKTVKGKASTAVADHIRIVHERQKKTCDICGKQFSARGYTSLAKHKFKVHQIQTRDHKFQYPCPTCGQACSSPGALTYHMVAKHGIVPEGKQAFSCPECDKMFPNKAFLKYHMDTHDGTRRHACPECDYRANQFGTLKTHIKLKHKRDVKRLSGEGGSGYVIVDVDKTEEEVC